MRRLAVGAAVLFVAALFFAQAVHGSAGRGYETVRVRAGDTLWSIALRRYPQADPREKVDEIMRANRLEQPVVQPGETLRVPSTG